MIPQLVPLAFLILASITAPTLSNIYLAKDSSGTSYGIFGYCSSDSSCTSPSIHTDLSSVLNSNILSSSTINKLVPFLIIAPISAALTFISLFSQLLALSLSKISNFFKSTFYWLLTIIISILAFLTSCFICIVTFLIFYPNVKWLAWCLIPTAILNLSTVIDLFLSYNHLTSLDDDESADESSTINKNPTEKRLNLSDEIDFDNFNNSSNNNNNINTTNRSIPQIEKPNNNFTFMSHSVNSSASSSFFKDHDNITAEKVYTQNSSTNLRVPEITNPYLNDIESSIHNNDLVTASSVHNSNNNNNNNDTDDDDYDNDNSTTATSHYTPTQNELDNRISGSGHFSADSSSSNFTSISQRPINPNYYAGASASIPPSSNFNRQPLNSSNLQPQSQYFNKQQQQQQQQEFHQQRQFNQYQNQMTGMPQMQNSRYGNKPKPYMVMAQRQQQQFNRQPNQRPPYQNQFHQMNPYAPSFNNSQQQRSNGFVPMKYRTRNNVSPAYSLGNDGPYSGFR